MLRKDLFCADLQACPWYKDHNRSYPPVRGKRSQGHDLVFLIIQHHFHILISLRHELCHKLTAGTAGRHDFSVPIHSYHPPYGVLAVGKHIKNRISFGTDPQGAGAIHANTHIDPPGCRFDGPPPRRLLLFRIPCGASALPRLLHTACSISYPWSRLLFTLFVTVSPAPVQPCPGPARGCTAGNRPAAPKGRCLWRRRRQRCIPLPEYRGTPICGGFVYSVLPVSPHLKSITAIPP